MSFILGIAGGSASGKSTIAAALAERLGDVVTLIVHDRYYHNLPQRFHDKSSTFNFDHPDALNTAELVSDLNKLIAGETTTLPRYDFASHARAPIGDVVQPTPLIIVEGILVLSDPALRAHFDFSVFVDTPDNVRLQRRIVRDVAERGRTEAQVREQVAMTVQPMHDQFVQPSMKHAGLVVSGERALQGLVDEIVNQPAIRRALHP